MARHTDRQEVRLIGDRLPDGQDPIIRYSKTQTNKEPDGHSVRYQTLINPGYPYGQQVRQLDTHSQTAR